MTVAFDRPLPHNSAMEEEEIVIGAQVLGRALKVLGLVAAAALAVAAWWLWRRFA